MPTPHPGPRDGPGDIERWAAEVRDDAAIAERSRAASMRRQAALGATLAAVLAELAATGDPVEVRAGAGEPLRGTLAGVAADHLRLRVASGGAALVATGHVRALRALGASGPGAPTGPAAPAAPAAASTLAAALRSLAEAAGDVAIVADDGQVLVGRVVAAGDDVVAVLPEGTPPGRPTWVPLTAVAVVRPGGA